MTTMVDGLIGWDEKKIHFFFEK